jgi:hypothetical protein
MITSEIEKQQEDDEILEQLHREKKKPGMEILNKKKLSKFEMDELFLDGEPV